MSLIYQKDSNYCYRIPAAVDLFKKLKTVYNEKITKTKLIWQDLAKRSHLLKALKEQIFLCGTNNLKQDSSEDITDGIIEVANTFKYKCGSISIFVCGILPRDFNWSVNRV